MNLTEKGKVTGKPDIRVPTFTKEQIITSVKYDRHRDVVNALLEDGKMYTIAQVDGLISGYMKGKVK